jgi:tetratricopeptide (TPR) repeat protein
MPLISRLLSRLRRAPVASPLANFKAIFAEPPPHPDQDAAVPADPLADAHLPQDIDTARRLLDYLIAAGNHTEAHRTCVALSTGSLGPSLNQQVWFLRRAIRQANRAADHAHTIAWSARLRILKPADPAAYTAAAAAIRALGRPQDASSLAEEGLIACPHTTPLLLEAAHAAEAASRNDAAYAHWARLRVVLPKNAAGFAGATRLSVKLNQPDITKTLLGDGLKVFPANRDLLLVAAQDAIGRLDWDQAAIYWDALIARFKDKPALALMAAKSFIGPMQGRKERLPGVLARLKAIQASHPNFVPAITAYQQVLHQAGRLEKTAELRKRPAVAKNVTN